MKEIGPTIGMKQAKDTKQITNFQDLESKILKENAW